MALTRDFKKRDTLKELDAHVRAQGESACEQSVCRYRRASARIWCSPCGCQRQPEAGCITQGITVHSIDLALLANRASADRSRRHRKVIHESCRQL